MAKRTRPGRRVKRKKGGFLTTGIVVVGACLLFLGYSFFTHQFADPAGQAETAIISVPVGFEVKIDVRNGSDVSGLAGKFTLYLRDRGFDVVESGNFSKNDIRETYLINRSGKDSLVVLLAQSLGIPESRIRKDVDTTTLLDATVVIGRDYRSLKPFEQEEAETP